MSYAMARRHGFGAAAPTPCGPNSGWNSAANACYCQPGFDWASASSADCVPINVAAPCVFVGERRNPVDKKCECPPGMHVDPAPGGNSCIRFDWFPTCVDATGARVPNCFMGAPLKQQAIAAGVGAAVGIALAFMFNAVRS